MKAVFVTNAFVHGSHVVIVFYMNGCLGQMVLFVEMAEGHWPSERQVGDPTAEYCWKSE